MMDNLKELIERLKIDAEWAEGQGWETPLCLWDDLTDAVSAIATLVEENAQLTVQHEADQQTIRELRERFQEENAQRAAEAYAAYDKTSTELAEAKANLAKAIEDLHFVMGGGDPCEVCSVKCPMGENNCKPKWRGEENRE